MATRLVSTPPSYVPASLVRIGATSRTDQVYQALRGSGVMTVDSRPALLEAKARERFVVTTDPEKGDLLAIARQENYPAFVIPPNVGGRFSVLTPAGTLPASLPSCRFRTPDFPSSSVRPSSGLRSPAGVPRGLVGPRHAPVFSL